MSIHTDFRGQPLQVGDKIVVAESYGRRGGRTLKEVTIERLTDTMVVYVSPDRYGIRGKTEERRISTEYCVRLV